MQRTIFYTTIENQVKMDDTRELLYTHYDDINLAYAKFYGILAAAAIGELPYQAAAILRSDGIMIESKVFDRRINDPEPEFEPLPEPEPESETEPEITPQEEGE